MRTIERRRAAMLFVCLAVLHAVPEALSAQSGVQPRSGAGYVGRDGHIQVVACACMSEPVKALDDLFAASHAGTKFDLRLGDNYSAMAALTFDRTAFAAMGSTYTRIGLGDNLKITPPPVAIRIAHASLAPGSAVPALGVIVNAKNPLTSLTLDQVTRIFTVGAAAGDIALWRQAGVGGALAERTIHPVGLPGSDYTESDDPQAGEFLGLEKFGGLVFNHTYEALPHYADVVERVRDDVAAVGITALNVPLSGVNVIALKKTGTSPAVGASAADVGAGNYPLDRYVYLYLRSNKGSGLDPFAVEYARTALSAVGQRAIAAGAAGYIPLTPEELAEERAKVAR